ncbi:MAG: DMT family transporter, partial [Bacteroidales bacterium]|nr:DMT family transporter [Bacteroidales bacterium]
MKNLCNISFIQNKFVSCSIVNELFDFYAIARIILFIDNCSVFIDLYLCRMNLSKIKAHTALIVVNVIYGVNFIAVKEIIPEYFEWQSMTLFRAFGALVLFFIAGFFIKRQKIERADMWKFVVGGLLGVTVSQSLLIWGLQYTSSMNASIIMTMNPLFVMIFAALILRFPITKVKLSGIVVGGIGACILIFTSANSEHVALQSISLGDAIILANAVLYGLYLVWTKPLMEKYDALTVMFFCFLFGAIPVLLYGLEPTLAVDFRAIPAVTYVAIAFVVVCATFITYVLNAVSLKYVNPTTVSIYVYLQPVVATLLSIDMHGDQLSWHKIVSMLLVFAGVYLVNMSN